MANLMMDLVVLSLVWNHRGIRVRDLRKETRESSTAISRRLQRMQAEGLITITQDVVDQRTKIVELTDEGNEALARFGGERA